MKTHITPILAVLLALTSCGSAAQYASYTSGREYEDGIYYKPKPVTDKNAGMNGNERGKIDSLVQETRNSTIFLKSGQNDTLYIPDNMSAKFEFNKNSGTTVTVSKNPSYYYDPLYSTNLNFYNPLYFNSWYWSPGFSINWGINPWYYSSIYDPWYWNNWYWSSWNYGPWYYDYGMYNPWFWDGGYLYGWYGGDSWYGGRPSHGSWYADSRKGTYWGSRNSTEGPAMYNGSGSLSYSRSAGRIGTSSSASRVNSGISRSRTTNASAATRSGYRSVSRSSYTPVTRTGRTISSRSNINYQRSSSRASRSASRNGSYVSGNNRTVNYRRPVSTNASRYSRSSSYSNSSSQSNYRNNSNSYERNSESNNNYNRSGSYSGGAVRSSGISRSSGVSRSSYSGGGASRSRSGSSSGGARRR